MNQVVSMASALGALCISSLAAAASLSDVQFRVIDTSTGMQVGSANVVVQKAASGLLPMVLAVNSANGGRTVPTDFVAWGPASTLDLPTVVTLPLGESVILHGQTGLPVRDIFIKVTATRLQVRTGSTSAATTRDKSQLQTFINTAGASTSSLVQGQSGVATDSNGQQHVRGEHTEITYVVDGVPLPDTLSGRQGSIVVPSTIDSLEMFTGGFPAEFGGQTAAILNITTLAGAKKARTDLTLEAGTYATANGDLTSVGPLGAHASYVLDIGATRTGTAQEPQQPDIQDAHNDGSNINMFGKLRLTPGKRDTVTVTLSRAPASLQLTNRTGLPASFAPYGQGYGFLGLRNADGSRPDVQSGATDPGAQIIPLRSQQADGQDINDREVNEFATLSWRRLLSRRDVGQLALTLLHSGQEVRNGNPSVDLFNLPLDNSIEYNPTATRNAHHVQLTGSVTLPRGSHEFKAGVLLDNQSGNESYRLVPASALALDELAALDPALAPAGAVFTAEGAPVKDVTGNPIFKPTSSVVPTLRVHRSGFYRAAYAQDTWKHKRLTANIGLRGDWYKQSQTLDQPTVDVAVLEPRLNFGYALDTVTALRLSYNRLFNTPPLAQGAVVGEPVAPETLSQYDFSIQRQIARGQTVQLAYYVKDIRNQVDVGLLVPGSQIGIYSGVNFQIGGVHGVEFSYNVSPPHGVGLDAYLNYTYSIARPNGVDNTGANAPDFNDHDQRNTVSLGLAYLWRGGANVALTVNHGSGLASSSFYPGGPRSPRTVIDFRTSTGDRLFHGSGGIGLDIDNLLDVRTVMNFQSAFSGTRFQPARHVLVSAFAHF